MSDPKSVPTISFGQPATTGSSGSIFGQTTSDASKPASNVFGSGTSSAATSTANPFGNTSSAGGSALFGNPTSSSQPSIFGNAGGSNNLFGGDKKASGSGLNLGQADSQKNLQSSSPASSTGFSAFSTPSKPADAFGNAQNQSSNMFGGGGGGSKGLSFGNTGSNTASTGQSSTMTPTSKPTTSLFGNSTTPAGQPPNASTGAGAGSVGNLFAQLGSSSSAQNASSAAAPSSGSSIFSQSPNTFASTTDSSQSNLFGNKRSVQPEGNLFGNANKAQDIGSTKNTTPQQSLTEGSKTSSLFSNLGSQPSADSSAATTTNSSLFGGASSKPAFNFPKAATSEPSTLSSNTSNDPAPKPSSSFSAQGTGSATPASSASGPSSSIFFNVGKTQDKASAAEATNPSIPSTLAPPSAFSLFNKPTATPASSQIPSQPAPTNANEGPGAANANLGSSTAGPAPPIQSRLKNKTMDEIITRWASDLSKYQKQFQGQADIVAGWDRMLVENSDKIQRLYGSTLEAERATTEVERQLSAVQSDQDELSFWLGHYEKEVDSMMSNQVGQSESISGPDQERERT